MTVHIGFVELCTAVTVDGKISNQATEVKMGVHIGFVELCTAVTADGKISNQATEVKMAVHIGFVKLFKAVTTDGDISNQAKEVKMTVHIGFIFKYTRHLLVMATTSNQATQKKIKCMLYHVTYEFQGESTP